MDFVAWIQSTISADAIVDALGLLALALLFATDRIMTKGQHARRVADIVEAHERFRAEVAAHHGRELEAKDERLADFREARDILRATVEIERTRADKATDMLTTVGDYARLTNRLLAALDEVRETDKL